MEVVLRFHGYSPSSEIDICPTMKFFTSVCLFYEHIFLSAVGKSKVKRLKLCRQTVNKDRQLNGNPFASNAIDKDFTSFKKSHIMPRNKNDRIFLADRLSLNRSQFSQDDKYTQYN